MQRGELGTDENRDPEPEPRLLGLKKEKSRAEGQLHNLTNRIPPGPWESNGHGPEAAEGGAPLSPSNTLNIRNLQLSEREVGPPAPHRYPHRYHPHPRPFHASHRRSYRPGAKEWGPSTNGHGPGDGRGGWAARRRPFPEPPCSPEPAAQASGHSATPEVAEKVPEPWALFRPPPAFPVDSSRARTLPKISYASKLKENLERQPAHVPASALRTAGPLPNCTPPPPAEPHLGAIFQNEWGLSFINEPGAGQTGDKPLPLGPEETSSMSALGLQGPGDPAEGPLAAAGQSTDCWEQMSHKDWEEACDYHTEAWDHIWKLHRQVSRMSSGREFHRPTLPLHSKELSLLSLAEFASLQSMMGNGREKKAPRVLFRPPLPSTPAPRSLCRSRRLPWDGKCCAPGLPNPVFCSSSPAAPGRVTVYVDPLDGKG